MNNSQLLDAFKSALNLKTDKEAAWVLDEASSNLAAWKSNKRPMPVPIKMRLLTHAQFSPDIEKIAYLFVDKAEHDGFMSLDRLRASELRDAKAQPHQDTKALMEFKTAENLTDEQIADRLFIPLEILNLVLSGKASLPVSARALLAATTPINRSSDK